MSRADPNKVLYPVVFEDHDGSWTWSVESGKPYEPGHRIHARGDGCLTKKAARTAAENALNACSPTSAKTDITAPDGGFRGWAVVGRNKIIAVFRRRKDANAFSAGSPGTDVKAADCRYQFTD